MGQATSKGQGAYSQAGFHCKLECAAGGWSCPGHSVWEEGGGSGKDAAMSIC